MQFLAHWQSVQMIQQHLCLRLDIIFGMEPDTLYVHQVFQHHAQTIFQMISTARFGKLGEEYHTSQDTWKMIRSRPIFLTLNKLEAKLIAKALKFTTSHARAEIGFTEYQMFNELTKRMQAIARGEEKHEN